MKFNDIYNYILTERNTIDLSQHKGRSKEDRKSNLLRITLQKIQDYIRNEGVGDLDLSDTPITSLPTGLRVGGHLWLYNTPITSLPADLRVGKDLWLDNTPITSLPAGLQVGENLSLINTPITSLPADLRVGGELWLDNTPIAKKYPEDEIRKMVPRVKRVYLHR